MSWRGAQDLARRILNRLKKFSDTPEVQVPSGAEEDDHKVVTPNKLSAFFTAKGRQGDISPHRPEDAYCPSPPRCLSSIPVLPCERSLPEEWDFYDSHLTASTRTKPKASRVRPKVPRLSFDHIGVSLSAKEEAAGQVAERSVRRRSGKVTVIPLNE